MAYRNKITLQLGLITFFVAIDSATAKEEGLNNVCLGDTANPHEPTRIKQTNACPQCQNADWSTFKKARVEGSTYTIIDADEVKKAKEETVGGTKQTIALTAHPTEEVRANTVQDGSVYYLTPSNEASAKGYALLVETLKEHPEIALLGLWTPVSRTALYEVKLFGDTLVMEQRARTEAIKVVPVPATTPDPMMTAQMGVLLPMMTQPFDPATYADTYRAKLDNLVQMATKVEGAATGTASGSTAAPAVDLMAQLNAMVAAAGAANVA